MSALLHVPFHGDELVAVQDEAGVWVSVRRVCENLGLHEEPQRKKLRGRAWATTALKAAVAEDGKRRQQFMVHIDSLPMWLATIEASRVPTHVRPKLERYQVEAAAVLAAHFLRTKSDADYEAYIGRLLLLDPIKRDRLFPEQVWRAIESLYRPDATTAVRPSAAFRGYVGHIYLRFFGRRAKAEIRERNPAPERDRDYWLLTPSAFEELQQHQWHKVEALAMSAHRRFGCSRRAREEFWADLNHLTGYKPALGEPNPADERQLLLFERLDDGEAA